MIGGSGSIETNELLILINNESDFDKIYLYAKDPYEAKCQLLIKKIECARLKYLNDSNALIDIYENIEVYNPNTKRKILIVFDDTISEMLSNKELNSIATELFIRGEKLNISLLFITQSYFVVPKNIRLNSTYYFVMKIPNKRELQKTAINHSSEIFIKHVLQNYIRY